ncbi:unnamed protein product [Ascophyllum nodosum]
MAVSLAAELDAYAVMETDGVDTATSLQQMECERTCELSFLPLMPGALDEDDMDEFREDGIINAVGEAVLLRSKHEAYLVKGLAGLGPGFVSLDASRPWMVYWILHSLDLLGRFPGDDMLRRVVETVASCQDPNKGGFGGGPRQLPHCAPMYASVLSLLIVGTPEAYDAIDRPALYRFFVSLKHPSGGFRMHDDGEVDARGTYTVIAVASLLNMLTPQLSEGVADFAVRCQTYEGGFGGEPWNEAHGGYTFCAFASLLILGKHHQADLEALRRWLCGRQMRAEGGFQGRTNKLVDGCYSFWQGGAVALLDYVTAGRESEVSHRDRHGRVIATQLPTTDDGRGLEEGEEEDEGHRCYSTLQESDGSAVVVSGVAEGGAGNRGLEFARDRLQEYVLMCSQQVDGGLRDKPGKPRDFYHTCYTLSGLSVAQHCLTDKPSVVGDPSNQLRPTNPVYNIAEDKAKRAAVYFAKLPSDHDFLIHATRTQV